MATRLTNTAIESALARRPDGCRIELADDREFGLRLRAGRRGGKWSLLSQMPDGERIRVQIGSWPGLGISEARKEAQSIKRQLEKGVNPNEAKRAARDHATVAELLNVYERLKLSKLRDGINVNRALRRVLKQVLDRDPAAVTRHQIAVAIDRIAEKAPISGNRSLAYCRAFFNWSRGRGHIEVNPAASIPKPSPEVTRDRTPSPSELAEIWGAAGTIGFPFGIVIKLLIVTAMRREEVGSMRISELDLDCGSGATCATWTLPPERSKNGRAIRIPLSPLARSLILEAQNRPTRPVGADLLFTTTGTTPVSGWSKAKRQIDEAIMIHRSQKYANEEAKTQIMPEWRIHDLRRSFATIACDVLLVDPGVADRCLNHVGASTSSTIARVYGRNEMFEQRKSALFAWSEFLEKTVA
jgi:integrase